MAKHGDEDALGVLGIDDDGGNLLAVAQAGVLPSPAAVGGFVDSISGREIGALEPFAAADVDDVGVGRGHSDAADGASGLVVEDRLPGAAGVGGLPNTAVVDADVKQVRPAGHAGRAVGAPAAKRPNHPPAQLAVQIRIERAIGRDRRGQDQQTAHGEKVAQQHECNSWTRRA